MPKHLGRTINVGFVLSLTNPRSRWSCKVNSEDYSLWTSTRAHPELMSRENIRNEPRADEMQFSRISYILWSFVSTQLVLCTRPSSNQIISISSEFTWYRIGSPVCACRIDKQMQKKRIFPIDTWHAFLRADRKELPKSVLTESAPLRVSSLG